MGKPTPDVPTYDALLLPTLRALTALGGSGTTEEINSKVAELLCLPEKVLDVPHGNSSQTEVGYRLAWCRTGLKAAGLVQNSARGVWSLTPAASNAEGIDARALVRAVREANRKKPSGAAPTTPSQGAPAASESAAEGGEAQGWQQEVRDVLATMHPSAFERLIQRLLRESGFIQVEVTGKSGDGGIDGIGIARINGFLSFHVRFQCKRYQGAITPSQIRDFRGAMQGRTDKGLFITTGTFTREAIKEATRDGAPPIDFIDGEELVMRLKELKLGVTIQMVESITVDKDWFAHI